jgi:dipeptidyl aminopeptidase/acylaminoacyl peptidase
VPEPLKRWVGTEEYGGVPTPSRREPVVPAHWRLEAIAATERPRSLSPAGDRRTIAFIHDRDTSDVWLLDAETGATRRLTTGRDPQPYWEDTTPVVSPDGSTVAYGDQGWVWLVPATGGPPRRLVEAGSPVWLPDGRLVVTVERDERTRLALVDAADGWPRPLVRSAAGLETAGDEGEAAVSPDGRTVAYTFRHRHDLSRSDIRVVDVETGIARGLTGAPATRDAEPAWSPDGCLLAFTAQRGEWYDLRVVDPFDGDERLLAAPEGDVTEPRWRPDGAALACVVVGRITSDLVLVDAASGEIRPLAKGGCWGAPCWRGDGALVCTYEDHATAPELRVALADGRTETLLAPAPASVRAAPHVRPEEVWFTSAGGFEVQALLFRPPAADGRRVPAVVYPHGGPTERYGDEWDGHAQFFLEKGYAWLAVNYRGSTGRGKAVERMNFFDWGGGDAADCLAAADFLRTLDWVDGHRLAVFGASYGSYMALCAAVEDAGQRFRCAVCKYGDCDLLTTWSQGDRSGVYYCGENMLGHPGEHRDVYLRGSPIHRVDRVAASLLVATGELDERVNPKQSAELVDALRRLGKTYEYVTYPTEGHGFLRAGPQVEYYRRLERFLDWYLL